MPGAAAIFSAARQSASWPVGQPHTITIVVWLSLHGAGPRRAQIGLAVAYWGVRAGLEARRDG
jgi:hypothetical protein